LRRVLTLPLAFLARTEPSAKRRTTAMFLAPLDVDRRGGDEACVAGAFVGMLGAALDFEEGLDVGKARLARIARLRADPIHTRGGGEGARLEAAVPFSTVVLLTSSSRGAVRKQSSGFTTAPAASVTSARIPGRAVPFEEHIVLPAAHAQQNAPDDGEMVRMFGVDRYLSRRPARNVVG
jgi:hypothetical protein